MWESTKNANHVLRTDAGSGCVGPKLEHDDGVNVEIVLLQPNYLGCMYCAIEKRKAYIVPKTRGKPEQENATEGRDVANASQNKRDRQSANA